MIEREIPALEGSSMNAIVMGARGKLSTVFMAAGCKCDGKRFVRLLGVFTYSEWIEHLNRQSPFSSLPANASSVNLMCWKSGGKHPWTI